MNRYIVFAGGFVGGLLAGFYFGSKKERIKCDIDIASVRYTYESLMADAEKKAAAAQKEADTAKEDRYFFEETLRRLGYTGASTDKAEDTPTVKEPIIDEPYFSEDESLDPLELDIPSEEEIQQMTTQRNRPPEIISEETFAEDFSEGYDKQDLLWYPEDRIMLLAETHELMDDPHSFLGLEWENEIERNTVYSQEGEAYVRNHRWGTDYFIYRKTGKGSEDMSLDIGD
jgi:hypothetical protein